MKVGRVEVTQLRQPLAVEDLDVPIVCIDQAGVAQAAQRSAGVLGGQELANSIAHVQDVGLARGQVIVAQICTRSNQFADKMEVNKQSLITIFE